MRSSPAEAMSRPSTRLPTCLSNGWIRICFHGIMQVDARKGGAEARDLRVDQGEIVDEQRRVARLGDQRVGAAAADQQHAVLVGRKTGRDRAHRLAHAISSLFSSTRSSLPLGERGSSSRQMIGPGCMKLGKLRFRKARSASSSPRRSGRTIERDPLAEPLVGIAERHRLVDQARGDRRLLDLGRADPVARGLDHPVLAADEIEQALPVPAHPVARPDRHAAIGRAGRRRLEPLGGPRRILPIALGDQRPGMDQLALRRLAAVGADHHDLGEGDGAAHRIRMGVEQGRLEIGRAERLGEPVHRIDVGGREDLAHPPHHRGRELAAAVGQPAQRQRRGGRPGRLDQLHPERRNAGQGADPVALDRADHVARGEIVERHDRAARGPGREAAGSARNRRLKRQHREHPVLRREAQIMRDADRAEPHIGVAQHHPLGPPGRARGVEQGGQVVRVVVRGRQADSQSTRATACFALVERSRAARGRSPASSVASARLGVSSRLAPLSARMWATCSRFSSGLTGTWIRPARAQASGSRLVSRVLGSQLATRSPWRRPLRLQARGQRADRRFEPGIIERRPRASVSAGAAGSPRSVR